jgi:chromate transporter
LATAAVFLRLGAQVLVVRLPLVGYMYRDLVEQRKSDCRSGLQRRTGVGTDRARPLAAQLAIYLGYVHYRVLGATVAGFAFVIPSFLMVVGLGWAYVNFGGLSWMQAVILWRGGRCDWHHGDQCA